MANLIKSINEFNGIKHIIGKLFIADFSLKGREVVKVEKTNKNYKVHFTGSGYIQLTSKSFNDKMFVCKNDLKDGLSLEEILKERLSK